MNINEAKAQFLADKGRLEQLGVAYPDAVSYIPDEFRTNWTLAMDALPTLTTGSANSGIPAFLTTLVDPDAVRIVFAPTQAAEIFGEVRKGSWTDQTAMFPVIEGDGEVSSYGDHSNNGRTGVNTSFPQRQSYLFQTVKEYGDLEAERAGLAKINWIGEIDKQAADTMNRFLNKSYFFGINGLQNYGLLNDPALPASLTPGTKTAGNGNVWVTSTGAPNGTANEVYADIQQMVTQLISQSAGLIDLKTPMTLAIPPLANGALMTTNSFGISVEDLLKKTFPNLTVKTAVQYGVKSAANPEGVAAGNMAQIIAGNVAGQDTGYCAFNEKSRSHNPVRDLSSVRQKMTGGTWGAILRQPLAIVSMVGI